MLLLRPRLRVVHATLGRVEVNQLPGDRPVQDLPERLRRRDAAAFGQARPPRAHLLGPQIDQPQLAEHARRLRDQPAQLRDRRRLGLVTSRYSSTRSRSVSVAARRPGRIRASVCRSASCASARVANPPTWGRFDPRPSTAVAVRPHRVAVPAIPLQLEHLAPATPSRHLLESTERDEDPRATTRPLLSTRGVAFGRASWSA